jgi:hypothetical protein
MVSTPPQHSASGQLFKDHDTLHAQRCRACHCIRPSCDHPLVPVPIDYAPNSYDSNVFDTWICMRLKDFFEPDHVPVEPMSEHLGTLATGPREDGTYAPKR